MLSDIRGAWNWAKAAVVVNAGRCSSSESNLRLGGDLSLTRLGMSQQSMKSKSGDPAVAFAPKISSAESGLNKKNAFCIYHPIGVSVLVATWGPSCHPFSREVACGVPLESGQGYLRVWEVRHPKQPENNGKACRLLSWVCLNIQDPHEYYHCQARQFFLCFRNRNPPAQKLDLSEQARDCKLQWASPALCFSLS